MPEKPTQVTTGTIGTILTLIPDEGVVSKPIPAMSPFTNHISMEESLESDTTIEKILPPHDELLN